MCLLIAKTAGTKLPDNLEDICVEAAEVNDDGFGFATPNVVWKNAKVDPKVFAKYLRRRIRLEDNAIIHFRYSTSGQINKNNCHPHRLRDGTIFAHNGNISWKYTPSNGLSDTAVLAQSAPNIEDLYEKCKWLAGTTNKFAILNPNDRSPTGLTIVGENFGEWKDGLWYSNNYWRRDSRKSKITYTTYPSNYHKLSDWQQASLDAAMQDLVAKYGAPTVRSCLNSTHYYSEYYD